MISLCLLPFILIGQQYQIRSYGSSEGMSEGPKTKIVQDSSGYLWVNTYSGINRFDGNNFKVYSGNPDDSTTFTNAEMLASYVSREGDIYIAGQEGLFKYDKSMDKFISCMDGYIAYHTESSNSFTGILQVGSSLYVTSYIGLHEYNLESHKWTYYDLTPDTIHKNNHHSYKGIRSIIEDQFDPGVLVLGGKMQIYKFDTRNKLPLKTYKIDKYRDYVFQIHDITQVDQNEFLLSTWGVGTLLFDLQDNTVKQLYLYDDLILDVGPYMINTDFEYLNDSMILITNKQGPLILYNFNDQSWSKYQLEGLRKEYSNIFKDKDGNLWLTNSDGLTKLSTKSYEEIDISGLNSRPIYWAIPDNSGENIVYFIGGDYPFKNSIPEITEGITTPFIGPKWDIYYDTFANQYVFPITDNTLSIFDLEKNTTAEVKLNYTTNFLDLLCTKDEYIASYTDRIIVFDKMGNQKSTYKIPSDRIKKFPYPKYDLSIGADSKIYLNGSQYIIIIDRNTSQTEFIEIKGMKTINGIHSIDSTIWIANVFDGISKFTFEKKDGEYVSAPALEKDNYFASRHSTIDENGIIWIAAYSGIKGFDTNKEKIIYNLDEKHNLSRMDEPVYLTNNQVFTATDNSFVKIDKHQKNHKIHDIQLSSITVGNKQLKVDSTINLSAMERNINFSWNTVYFGTYEHLSFYTKLEGWDEEWVYQGNNQSTFYPHLPHGTYTFKVKVEAPNVFETKTLNTFTIKTPWWKTKSFIILSLGALLLSLYLLYKWRIRQALSKSKIDKKIAELELKALRAQLNPHFIFNSLNSIKRLIQKNENPKAIDYLLLFSSMIRNVLDLSDKQEITLAEEIEFSEQYLKMEKLRFEERFDYIIDIEPGIDLDLISVPPMILQPHLENSLWHGIMPLLDKKGLLTLSVDKKNDDILISIDDNGIGRKASTKINEDNKEYKHDAKGSSISIDRIKLNSLIRQNNIHVKIIDKEDNDLPSGTIIQIQISKTDQ